MGKVVTLEGYVPIARYDSVPWTEARIDEAADFDGPWTAVETITLPDPDPDPTNPAERDLTTALATEADYWYSVVFLDAFGGVADRTEPVQTTAPSVNFERPYIDSTDLKRALTLEGTTFADWEIPVAISSTQAALHDVCGRRFDLDITAEVVRKFRPQSASLCLINDLVELVTLETDQDGDGEHEREWTEGTEFVLEPANALADGWPYTRIELNAYRAHAGFPHWAPQTMKVTGKWGWPAVPEPIFTCARIIATQLIKRMREVPFGVVVASSLDTSAAIRIARNDPHVMPMLAPYTREKI